MKEGIGREYEESVLIRWTGNQVLTVTRTSEEYK